MYQDPADTESFLYTYTFVTDIEYILGDRATKNSDQCKCDDNVDDGCDDNVNDQCDDKVDDEFDDNVNDHGDDNDDDGCDDNVNDQCDDNVNDQCDDKVDDECDDNVEDGCGDSVDDGSAEVIRLGYCFTPYQRLRLYNGAPFSRLLRHAGDMEDVFSA